MDKKNLGCRLKYLRKKRGMTLVQLAESSGVSNPYLSQIENGKFEPTVKVLSKIAKGLNVTITQIIESGIEENTAISELKVTENPLPIGSIIRGERMAQGLRVRELARRAGISSPYLSQLETGKKINLSNAVLEKISRALGVDLKNLTQIGLSQDEYDNLALGKLTSQLIEEHLKNPVKVTGMLVMDQLIKKVSKIKEDHHENK